MASISFLLQSTSHITNTSLASQLQSSYTKTRSLSIPTFKMSSLSRTTLLEYNDWPESRLQAEATKRKVMLAGLLFRDNRIFKPADIAELLHLDDGEALAADYRYDEMNCSQIRHELEMMGVQLPHQDLPSNILWHRLLTKLKRVAKLAQSETPAPPLSATNSSHKRSRSNTEPDIGYPATPASPQSDPDSDHENRPSSKKCYVCVKGKRFVY